MNLALAASRSNARRVRPLALAVVLIAFTASLVSGNHCALTGQGSTSREAVTSCCNENPEAPSPVSTKSECCILTGAPLPATASLPAISAANLPDYLPALDVARSEQTPRRTAPAPSSTASPPPPVFFVSVDLRRIVAALAPPRVG